MQTVERPRFRQDLVAEAIEEGGQKFIDVGDPDSGSMFRFYESEFSIACGMDGERDVAGIVAWAKDELGLMATSKEVRSVISTLASLSFLDQGPAARAAASDRPAAAAAATELASGVVVGQQQKRAPAGQGIDVELGSAGAKAAASAPMPKAGDIELGTPGAGAAVAKPPRPPVEDVGLGAPGARAPAVAAKSDVSLDLADHMGVKPADVKEAIRQSKQMSAVEVPKDLLEKAEAPVPPPKTAPAVSEKKPAVEAKPAVAPVSEKKPEVRPAETKPAPVPAPVAAEKKPEAKPVEKKPEKAKKPAETKPVVVAEKKPMPEAPKQGISPVLIILLVLAIGGAGAYFAWKYLISKKAETTSEVQPPPVTPGSQVAPQPPPPPPAPKGKIEIASGAPRDILSVFAGNVESIDTTERDVDTSDVIARLVGAKRLEGEMAALDKEIERRKAAVTAAEEARNKLNPAPAEGSGSAAQPKPPSEAQIKAADAKVETTFKALEDKQNERTTKEENLEKLYVRAPFEGHIVVLAKQGQKIEENTPIARITPKPAPTAVFKLEKNMTIERGLAVPIKVGEKMYTCEVADSNVDGTRVVCRQNAQDLAAGAEATLMVEQAQ